MSEILLQPDGDIVTVVLNRPEKLNALTRPMWQRLGEVMRELSASETVRCIVIRGAGDKAFAPGNDISEFEKTRSTSAQARDYGKVHHEALAALYECRHPIVALIKGICVGGGLEIASLCDLRICGTSSRFGIPINKLGLSAGVAEIQALVRMSSRAVALELLLEGRILGAEEAYQKGMVTRVVADEKVEEEAYATARRIADGAPLVARLHKRFMRRLDEDRPITQEDIDLAYPCYDTEDFRTGYRAFLAKTKPAFKGR
ncbi:enoyl-CoA hydratase [Sulfurifustis variabilis]|uniref:Enoyl-CoA hydratase n=1 Tax=Sulfurifustis variabilis TaxID=1675686 RepID=A0A1B4VA68_9GAMM|nr:enoyl-CoA hydratase-related protein [Sulfurifustis variabilis]BAU46701.1 enoyl-CoA hydratase [Sulfurifustis variabilis]